MLHVSQWKKNITQYYAEVKGEVKKATWPGRDELKESTLVVILATLGLAFFIFGVDQILQYGVKHFVTFFG